MGATIFLMVAVMFVGGITAIVFGMQVMLDHAKGRTTAWSKRTGKLCIIFGIFKNMRNSVAISGRNFSINCYHNEVAGQLCGNFHGSFCSNVNCKCTNNNKICEKFATAGRLRSFCRRIQI